MMNKAMTRIFQRPLVLSLALLVCLTGFSEPTFAKNKTKKKTAPVEVTADSRLAEWQQSPQAGRGTPGNLCERDYKELHVVYDYFSEIGRRLKPLSAEKRKAIEEIQHRIMGPHLGTAPGSDQEKAERERIFNEELIIDPDWYQLQLETSIAKAMKDMGPYVAEGAWKQQEMILHDYLANLRGKNPYTVAVQAQPFLSLKSLMEIKSDIATVFDRLDDSKIEFDRLLEFDRIHALGLDDQASYLILKNSFLSGAADPVIACHLDYLSSF
jgi:hypothetical protein